jgi:hypothetical protein
MRAALHLRFGYEPEVDKNCISTGVSAMALDINNFPVL